MDPKPSLHLVNGQKLTPEQAAAFYAQLTGRVPTAEEMQALRARFGRKPLVIDLNQLDAGQPHWLSKPARR